MKRILLVIEQRPIAPPLTEALFERTQELTWDAVNSVDEARRVLSSGLATRSHEARGHTRVKRPSRRRVGPLSPRPRGTALTLRG
jgi:hypothetical protein